MEKKRTNSGPLMESTSKHSIYPYTAPRLASPRANHVQEGRLPEHATGRATRQPDRSEPTSCQSVCERGGVGQGERCSVVGGCHGDLLTHMDGVATRAHAASGSRSTGFQHIAFHRQQSPVACTSELQHVLMILQHTRAVSNADIGNL